MNDFLMGVYMYNTIINQIDIIECLGVEIVTFNGSKSLKRIKLLNIQLTYSIEIYIILTIKPPKTNNQKENQGLFKTNIKSTLTKFII